jgi:hypothetical protein
VERLRRAEAAALQSPQDQHVESVENCRAELTRIEASAAAPIDHAEGHLLARVFANLPSDRCCSVSAWASPPRGCGRWPADPNWRFTGCLPQNELKGKIAITLDAIRQDRPEASAVAADLYAGLFGGVASRVSEKTALDALARQESV